MVKNMKEKILKYNPLKEYFFEEGCFINEIFNDPEEVSLSIAWARVKPGARTRLHRVKVIECYLILEGKGRVEVGDLAPQDVGAGDLVFIPIDYPQRITNTGKSDLLFLAICTPRFRPVLYEDIEDFVGI